MVNLNTRAAKVNYLNGLLNGKRSINELCEPIMQFREFTTTGDGVYVEPATGAAYSEQDIDAIKHSQPPIWLEVKTYPA